MPRDRLKRALFAIAPDGSLFTYRTGADYKWAALAFQGGRWQMIAKGSVRERVEFRAGREAKRRGIAFAMVPLHPKRPAYGR